MDTKIKRSMLISDFDPSTQNRKWLKESKHNIKHFIE